MTHASALPSSHKDILAKTDIIGMPEGSTEKNHGSKHISNKDPASFNEPLTKSAAQKNSNSSAKRDMARKVSSEKPSSDYGSALEKLRRSSAALSEFAEGLRQQYVEEDVYSNHPSSACESHTGAQASLQHQHGSTVQGADALTSDFVRLSPQSTTGKQQAARTLPGKGLLGSAVNFFVQTAKQPEVFAEHYGSFAKELVSIVKSQSNIEPERKDKRFRDLVWRENFFYRVAMQSYLAWDKEVSGWVNDLDLEESDRRRSRFLYQQISALISPTNSPLNPVAVKRAYQTGGLSVLDGFKHLLDDLQHNHGMPSQIRSDAFSVGVDLANTEGAVVYRSEVLELIQYKMKAGTAVSKRPVLIVPPQLNKFYVFDLSPKNSLIRHLQDEGIQPFIISWRNPSKDCGRWDLDYYVSELEQSIAVMLDITGADKINLTSACAGGLTSMALLGYLDAANKPLVHSHSMFVTALRADDSSSLGLFATRELAEFSRKISEKSGYMDGKMLSHIFNWLRPTELVWNYWVNNYLLGKEPPSMDVLYWDNDSTRLPAKLHSDFLDIFIEDSFSNPDTLVVKGHPIDVKKLSMDFYCVGGEEDYLMPWKRCFDVPSQVSGECTFVLSTSGHIQSVLRPPGIANTFYYLNDSKEQDAEAWLETATKCSGTWWTHWSEWLNERGGEKRIVADIIGNEAYPPLTPAPGLYVVEQPD